MTIPEGILVMVGIRDAINGTDPDSPESGVAAYYYGRNLVQRVGKTLAKELCAFFVK